eukprot:g550.t1
MYDCNDNCRARKDGNTQECIDKALKEKNPFGKNKKNVVIKRNWDASKGCCEKCEKEIEFERYFATAIFTGVWSCADNCRAREEHSQSNIDCNLKKLVGRSFGENYYRGLTIKGVKRDWDDEKGCCADKCPPHLGKWKGYFAWNCNDNKWAMGSPAEVAKGTKTTCECIKKHLRCAITGRDRAASSDHRKFCRPFGPDKLARGEKIKTSWYPDCRCRGNH